MHAQDQVRRLMTEAVLSVEVSAPMTEALRLFAEYPVHHLPVVRDRTLVGMLSSADMMKLEGFLPKGGKPSPEYLDQRFRIEMLMHQPVISVRPEQSLEDAARLMATHAIHALPVVNAQSRLLGIVTTTDLMQALLKVASHSDGGADALQHSSAQWRPTPAAVEAALRAAREATLANQDPQGIAQALLHLHEQVGMLEDLRQLVRRHLIAGQNEAAALLKALGPAEHLE